MKSWMKKAIHIVGIISGYAACVAMIIAGAINQTPGVAGWKFVMLGIVFAICATIALIDGAHAFPKLGLWKVGAKYEGLNDLATFVIILLIAPAFIIAMSVN